MSQNCFLKHVHKVLESIAMICLTILLACGSELYREHCGDIRSPAQTCQFPDSVYTKSQSMSVLVCWPQKQDYEDHASFWTQSRLSKKYKHHTVCDVTPVDSMVSPSGEENEYSPASFADKCLHFIPRCHSKTSTTILNHLEKRLIHCTRYCEH